MREEFLFVEKYRPHKIADCILPEDLKQNFQAMVDQGDMPNLIFVGPPGSGKTTVAKAMLDELGCDYLFIPASIKNGIDVLRTEIMQFASSTSFTGKRKYVILDEADYLTHNTQHALRNFMEEYSANCGFILTANIKNKIIGALYSRGPQVEFVFRKEDGPKLAAKFYKRVLEILDKENITYDKAVVVEIVNKYYPDFRRTLNELQMYGVGGSIDNGILNNLKSVSLIDLITFMKSKDFTNVKKWVLENASNDSQLIYNEFYEQASNHFQTSYIPFLITILARYQYQDAFVINKELNACAAFIEIMMDAVWK